MKRIFVSFAALALSVATALPAAADVLYSQRTDPTLSGEWQSETANGVNGFNQAFDDFSLATTQTITNVAWTGFLLQSYTTIDDFTISFYQDNFDTSISPGSVGTLLASTTVVGEANQVANSTPDARGYGVFNFNTAIDPFVATAGTTYWISIVANPETNSGDVYWAFSDQGDTTFDTYDGNYVTSVGTDLAFTLSTASTPEPSGLVLMGSGMLALMGAARRKLAR